MRTLTTAFATLILVLTGLRPALAETDGPTCRAECAPRIEAQCGRPGVKGFKKCRRKLVRACKRTTPAEACALPERRDDDPNGGGGSGGDGGTGDRPAGEAITQALGDRVLEIGRNEFFSSGSITETQVMTLCASGSLRLVVTTVTTSSIGDIVNTFDSEEIFDGTWRVRRLDGTDVLELATGEAQPRRFAVEVAADGTVVLDGTVADVRDGRGQCGTGGGGTDGGALGDLVQQLTQALSDQAVFVVETNSGFGRRTTAMVLCASGRYALQSESTISPGAIRESVGAWGVVADVDRVALVLEEDGTGTQTVFALSTDADGNLLANGALVQQGDPAVVGQVCPQI